MAALSESLKRRATASSEQKNSVLPDYEVYKPDIGETATSVGRALVIMLFISILCYNSFWALLILLPYIPFHFHKRISELREKRKWELNLQFGDAIQSLSAVLESGYSIENAVTEAYNDLKLSYSEDAMIMKELKLMQNLIKNNVPVESAFSELAERSGLEDIKSFSDVFSTAKRTGGNIIAIIRSTTSVIRTRVELKRELKTLITSKKYESDIMRLIPFGVLIYLRIFSPDMVASLYGNAFGIGFMTVVLAVYLALSMVSGRIIRIEY